MTWTQAFCSRVSLPNPADTCLTNTAPDFHNLIKTIDLAGNYNPYSFGADMEERNKDELHSYAGHQNYSMSGARTSYCATWITNLQWARLLQFGQLQICSKDFGHCNLFRAVTVTSNQSQQLTSNLTANGLEVLIVININYNRDRISMVVSFSFLLSTCYLLHS